MLTEQINALTEKEKKAEELIESLEEKVKTVKVELAIIKRAKKSLERMEEQLSGSTTVSD